MTDSEFAVRHPMRAWGAVIVLMIFQTVALVDRNILSLMVIEVRRDLGLNDFQVSLLQGFAFSGFYCIAGLFIGGLVDRYPAKRLLIYICVTIWSCAATTVGFVRSFLGILLARMMTGAGQGGISPAAQVLIASLFPKNRVSTPMSLFVVSGALGIGLSYFGGGLLLEAITARSLPGLEAFAPWRQVVIVTAVPGLLLAFLSFTLPSSKAHGEKTAFTPISWREFGSFLSAERSLMVRLIAGYGLITVANFAMSSWAPTYARRVLQLTPSQVGIEMGLVSSIGSMLSAALYGAIVDRQFSRGKIDFVLRAYGFGMIIAIPLCVLGFTLNQNAAFIVALIATQVALVAPLGPGIAAIQMVTPPEMRGRMAALVIFIVNLAGYGGGSMVVGALTEFFFVDPQKVGFSIALTVVVVGPISALFIWSARPYFVARIVASAP